MKLGTLTLENIEILKKFDIGLKNFIEREYTDDIKNDVARYIFNEFVENVELRKLFDYTTEEISEICSIEIYDDTNYPMIIDKMISGMDFEPEALIEETISIVKKEFNEQETKEKADGDIIIDVTLSDGTELKYYVSGYGSIEYIEEDGDEALDKWKGKFDLEVSDYYSNLSLPETEDELSPMEIDDLNYEKATKKLSENLKEVKSGGADWAVRTWAVNVVNDELGWYICDDECYNFDFVKRTCNEDGCEIEDIEKFEVSKVDDLLKYVSNYDFETETSNLPGDEATQQIIRDL